VSRPSGVDLFRLTVACLVFVIIAICLIGIVWVGVAR
jgi:hypothetical protein